ncbi:MAG: valine--tRNA ligase [bacterium]|nr:valine--tRNA ligase [bacterium]
MKFELDKAYQPTSVESKIYSRWEKSGFFNPDNLPAMRSHKAQQAGLPGTRSKTFSISMPPPSVTGELHLGHATGITIQDIMARYHRMKGDKVLYIPGTDHAGIGTQVMVEKLIKKSGLDRHKLGREQFIKKVWAWKKKYGSRITEQIRQLGTSCDWSREHFTMDKTLTKAVQTAFIQMYKDGLIYQGNRIINWCPRCSSALSDLEVKHTTTTGKLWYLKYPIFGSTKYITVATTRPETMLGDTAVAVNPKDKRYENFIGKTVLLPLINREIPIITDKEVDIEFGSGAVKVTPAHDHFDYELGIKHKLPIINVIGQDNKMTKEAGEFYGLSLQEARNKIIDRLEDEGLLLKTKDYEHNISRCERCSSPIEPLISKQWFIKAKPLAKKAIEAVKKGKIKILPAREEKVYYHWMNNIKDWCISRQLWWGHSIPIWYNGDKIKASVTKPTGKGWVQDTDTLDTWFSSGLWTFSTLGWPNKTSDLKKYHPTSVMETGWDILFFWVARMIMMSLYFMKEVPFEKVYLHGLVLDKDGRKMSKSKGTGIDPIPMTEKYGTDAIRLSLIMGTSVGQDYRLYEEKIAGYRNFVNKLWNVSRFILSQEAQKSNKPEAKTLADKWILNKQEELMKNITLDFENLSFSEAGTKIYEFIWNDFADWYIEISKEEKNLPLLKYILENILKLAHPFIPFVTEEIWSRIYGQNKSKLLMIQAWPVGNNKNHFKKESADFELIKQLITQIRNFRAEHKIPHHQKIELNYNGKNKNLIQDNETIILKLANLKSITKGDSKKITGTISGLDYYIEYKQDASLKQNEIKKISNYIQALEKKLKNINFTKHAPPEIVATEKKKLEEQQEKLKKLL